MDTIDFSCTFVRADGDRLIAAERLVCAFPHLFGATLLATDLSYDRHDHRLTVLLRFAAAAFDERARARLAFWTARAGGRATALDGLAPEARLALEGFLRQSPLKLVGLPTDGLFDRCASIFNEAGASGARRRSAADRPLIAMDLGGSAWEGITYDPQAHRLFVAAPLAPPLGDELLLALRIPGAPKPVGLRARVADVRPPAEARPGMPAGYALQLPAMPEAVEAALGEAAPVTPAGHRAAPRYTVKAPVKVELAATEASPATHLIEYATDHELQADYVENLSHGGAFVRCHKPQPVGTEVSLSFRLPNAELLQARGVVAFASGDGMGVRFTLDPEAEQSLRVAIAHLSARPRRALVVDDDPLMCRMLADALGERGFEVMTAPDGQHGMRVLSEELLGLDLLLTDVFMPGMDGEAFVQTIRHSGGEADLAIVVVTGQIKQGLERRLAEAGADAVLEKGLGAELVAQAADAALERKRLSRHA